jgi:hypothetical protein
MVKERKLYLSLLKQEVLGVGFKRERRIMGFPHICLEVSTVFICIRVSW